MKAVRTSSWSKSKAEIVKKQGPTGSLWVLFFKKDYSYTNHFPNRLAQDNKIYLFLACKTSLLSQFSRAKICIKFINSINKKYPN